MPNSPTTVLNHQQVKDKITRIAWQIYEEYYKESEVIIAGIADRGYVLAQLLQTELEKISAIGFVLHKLEFDKDQPVSSSYKISPDNNFENKCVVVVDDVLKSGATLIYACNYFLQFDIRNMKTVVLVDRNHKRFPIKADFKGLSLSTSLQEHVRVNIENEPFSAVVS